jgi:hypothetical protein
MAIILTTFLQKFHIYLTTSAVAGIKLHNGNEK